MYNVDIDEAYREIGKRIEGPEYHSVSDLIGEITDGKCRGKYGHKKEYWNDKYKLEKEVFAHFYEATVRQDDDKLKILKSMFPNAYAEFERMVQSI